MDVLAPISIDEYLRTSYHPDCDFVDGEVLERNVGKRRHGYAQSEIVLWFGQRKNSFLLQTFTEQRIRVAGQRVRIPDIVVTGLPIPEEEVFTAAPWMCIEIMSPDDTMAGVQDRLDEYLALGVPNVWVIDPWKHRGWTVSDSGWARATDGIVRSHDGRVAMPLVDVLLP